MRGCAASASSLLVLRCSRRDLGGAAERVLDRCEAFDEAGAAGEELGELVGGQLPR